MTDRVVAKVDDIVKYAGKLSSFGSGTATGEATGSDSIMSTTTVVHQSLGQMSELGTRSMAFGQQVFAEAYQVNGYLQVNTVAFTKFIAECTRGIDCSAMAAQAVATILSCTDADSAGEFSAIEVANALAYATATPNAQRPDGIPPETLGTKSLSQAESETVAASDDRPDAVKNPDDPFATTAREVGGSLVTTTYADGSYRTVGTYATGNGSGGSVVNETTKYYAKDGTEIPGSGQTEIDERGNGYQTTTRQEAGATTRTTRHDDGRIDVATTTKDVDGNDHTVETHFDAPAPRPKPEDGPIKQYFIESHVDGQGAPGGAYAGY